MKSLIKLSISLFVSWHGNQLLFTLKSCLLKNVGSVNKGIHFKGALMKGTEFVYLLSSSFCCSSRSPVWLRSIRGANTQSELWSRKKSVKKRPNTRATAIFKCQHESTREAKQLENLALLSEYSISQVIQVVMEVPLPVVHSPQTWPRLGFISPWSGQMWVIAVWAISGAGRLKQRLGSTASIVALLRHEPHHPPCMPTVVTTNESDGLSNHLSGD